MWTLLDSNCQISVNIRTFNSREATQFNSRKLNSGSVALVLLLEPELELVFILLCWRSFRNIIKQIVGLFYSFY